MNWEDLPLVLEVKDIQKVLKISKPIAYALTRKSGFPSIRVGKRVLIPRDGLKNWIEEGQGKKE